MVTAMVGVAQLEEHLVVVQDVAGSSPVTHPNGCSIRLAAASSPHRISPVPLMPEPHEWVVVAFQLSWSQQGVSEPFGSMGQPPRDVLIPVRRPWIPGHFRPSQRTGLPFLR